MFHYKTCGLDNVYLVNGYNTIEIDGDTATSIHNIDGLHEAIGRRLSDPSASLSGVEFRFLRIELDMSQKAFGALVEKSDQTVAIWEKEDKVPKEASVIIKHLFLESVGENPKMKEFLEQLNAIDRNHQEMNFEEKCERWELNEAAA